MQQSQPAMPAHPPIPPTGPSVVFNRHMEEGIRVVRLAPADSPDVRGWQFLTSDGNEVWVSDDPTEEPRIYLNAYEPDGLGIPLTEFLQSFASLHALVMQTRGFARLMNG